MKLGDYLDYAGALHRCVRIVDKQQTLQFSPTGGPFVMEEKYYELKNCKTGRLAFVVESTKLIDYVGELRPDDSTAFVMTKDAIPKDAVSEVK